MKSRAFTLIELLVVVLIIGILAAVALPQYTKAVEKAKATQALTLLKSAYQAAAAYYMANGTYPETFDDMGFEVPWTGTTKWAESGGVKDTKSNGEWSLQLNHTTGGSLALYMGRISGKYAGAGFGEALVDSDKQLQQGIIYCAERKHDGITFSSDLNAGDYCTKIMNGTERTGAATSFRVYTLP